MFYGMLKINNIIKFEDFEKAIMQKIMEKDTSVNRVLQEQYKKVSIEERKFTGVGFFTDFKVAENAPRITEDVPYGYGSVEAIINGINGFGFILFIKDGIMICLEGYTAQDSWPEVIYSYILR